MLLICNFLFVSINNEKSDGLLNKTEKFSTVGSNKVFVVVYKGISI